MVDEDCRRLIGFDGLIVVELDTAIWNRQFLPPACLDTATADDLLRILAQDLVNQWPQLTAHGMVLLGGLYEPCEILRPGFPLLSSLREVFNRGQKSEEPFQPRIIAVGSKSGTFSIPDLNPERRVGAGPTFLIPFEIVGLNNQLNPLADQLEEELSTRSPTAHLQQAIEEKFQVSCSSVHYASLGDVLAAMANHLEQVGLKPFWNLLRHGLFDAPAALLEQTPAGNQFTLWERRIYTTFSTFHFWATQGQGKELAEDQLAAGYLRWLRFQREYCAMLKAHGFDLHVVAAQELQQHEKIYDLPSISEGFLVERFIASQEPITQWQVIDHATPESGSIAYSVEGLTTTGEIACIDFYYPLSFDGLAELQQHLEQSLGKTSIHTTQTLQHQNRQLKTER